MSELLECTKKTLQKLIENIITDNFAVEGPVKMSFEVPANPKYGDLSCNVAMVNAKVLKQSPMKTVQLIVDNLGSSVDVLEKVEAVKPGFVNFFFNETFFAKVLFEIDDKKEKYGNSDYGQNKKVNIEFVSANPTGPMHLGNARGGALGDCLAAVMKKAGYDVCKEFYINDAGNQIDKFAKSLSLRYRQILEDKKLSPLPEDCYQGEDIAELAQEYIDKYGDILLKLDEKDMGKKLVQFALPKNISRMKNDMQKYRINYDMWFNESALHNDGSVDEVIAILKNKGLTYEKDGALWLKATALGQEKDEVLIRKNKTPTYFVVDIAYHRDKILKRCFDQCINIWGADHHGHVERLKKALSAVDVDSEKLDIVLMQLVKLIKDGEQVRMSKRTGKAISLTDLLEEVPIDSARFFFNLREATSQMDFDLDLAVQQDSLNPVYYVQYANARIKSIDRLLKASENISKPTTCNQLFVLDSAEEKALIKHLANYTHEIIVAAKTLEPSKVAKYVIELATLFHKFYNAYRVKNGNAELMNARLFLCNCVSIVIEDVLKMFGISIPQVM